jgi:hypothetical protein
MRFPPASIGGGTSCATGFPRRQITNDLPRSVSRSSSDSRVLASKALTSGVRPVARPCHPVRRGRLRRILKSTSLFNQFRSSASSFSSGRQRAGRVYGETFTRLFTACVGDDSSELLGDLCGAERRADFEEQTVRFAELSLACGSVPRELRHLGQPLVDEWLPALCPGLLGKVKSL